MTQCPGGAQALGSLFLFSQWGTLKTDRQTDTSAQRLLCFRALSSSLPPFPSLFLFFYTSLEKFWLYSPWWSRMFRWENIKTKTGRIPAWMLESSVNCMEGPLMHKEHEMNSHATSINTTPHQHECGEHSPENQIKQSLGSSSGAIPEHLFNVLSMDAQTGLVIPNRRLSG